MMHRARFPLIRSAEFLLVKVVATIRAICNLMPFESARRCGFFTATTLFLLRTAVAISQIPSIDAVLIWPPC